MKISKILKILVGLGVALSIAAVVVVAAFPVPLAQWSLKRLEPHGLSAKVTQANLLGGRMVLKDLRFGSAQQGTKVSVTAKEGSVSLGLFSLLVGGKELSTVAFEDAKARIRAPKMSLDMHIPKGRVELRMAKLKSPTPVLERLRLEGPSWKIRKAGSKPSASQQAKEAKEMAKLHQKMGKAAPSIRLIQIVRGSFSMEERKGSGRTQVKIRRLDVALKQLKGPVQVQNLDVSVREHPIRVKLSVKKAVLHLDLTRLLAGHIQIPLLDLASPTIDLVLDGQPKQQALPWLSLGRFKISRGTVALTLPPEKKSRRIRLKIQKMHAQLRDLSLRYLLARPFTADAGLSLSPYGRLKLSVKPLSANAYRFRLRDLPIAVVNPMLAGKKAPLLFSRGAFHVQMKFLRKSGDKVKILAGFQVHRIRTRTRKRGDRSPIRMIVDLINHFFQKHPKGIVLNASFWMTKKELSQRTQKLFGVMSKRMVMAFFDAVCEKIPPLRPFRGMLWDQLSGKAKRRERNKFQKLLRKLKRKHRKFHRKVQAALKKHDARMKAFHKARRKEFRTKLAKIKKGVQAHHKKMEKKRKAFEKKAKLPPLPRLPKPPKLPPPPRPPKFPKPPKLP